MDSLKIVRTIIALLISTMLIACSSNEMYRSSLTSCDFSSESKCEKNTLQVAQRDTAEEYRLGFIEYDDQGQLRNPGQRDAVFDEYRKIAGLEEVVLIVFVHGWHHSAKLGDGNIMDFRNLLKSVSKQESEAYEKVSDKNENEVSDNNGKPRKVLGIYVGWRGDSINIPVVNGATFWERKNTAHEVGSNGVTEALLRAEEIVHVKKGDKRSNSRVVVIGHSFGGAVVYSALNKVLGDRFIDSREGKTFKGNANGFGDLVLLVNPAFESLKYTSLFELSQDKCRGYQGNQLPKLVTMTSETDYATKYAFPIGRSFSTFFESHKDIERHTCNRPGASGMVPITISEGSADRTTVGHFDQYLTHTLDPATESQSYLTKATPSASIQAEWLKKESQALMSFDGAKLTSLNKTVKRNPYLNIKVSEEIMDGHNDIWGEQIRHFIRDMIVISTLPNSNNETQ